MQYLHAEKGIKKIYISQIIAVIALLLVSCSTLFVKLFIYASLDADEVISNILLLLVGGGFELLAVIAFVLMVIYGMLGYWNASKDDSEFRRAMICVLASGVLAIIGSLFQLPSPMLHTMFSAASMVLELFIVVYAISGIINLAQGCEHSEMADEGDRLLKIMVFTYIISAIDKLIIRIFELSDQAKIISGIMGVLDLIVSLLQYVLILRYLRKTENMLKTVNAANGDAT